MPQDKMFSDAEGEEVEQLAELEKEEKGIQDELSREEIFLYLYGGLE